ncbi:MAG: diguanylate cyclase [Candidatus Magnetomorum sp.]|nr:diguanylate cyclase [Candidatus Magnetomorum sp.]
MMDISGFRVVETVYESDQTIVQRALNTHTDMPVVLKCAKSASLTLVKRICFLHEYHTASTLQANDVIQPLGLINTSENLIIVYQDTACVSLSRTVAGRLFQTDEIIQLFYQAADAIDHVHSQGWIHMNLSLDHILFAPKTNHIYLIDWQSAIQMQGTSVFPPPYPRGNLETIPPEQTGYSNFSVDERSDLYSLGCIFYELFTHSPPFREKDSFRLIQAHVTSRPVPPHEGYDPYIPVTQHIPEAISHILIKLLSKDPSQRYDSAQSLKIDILSCIKNKSFVGEIQTDPKAIPERPIQKSAPLCHREKEIETLHAIYNSFCNQLACSSEKNEHPTNRMSSFLLLSGDKGTEKTALCKTLISSVWENNGFWLREMFSCTPDLPLAVIGRIVSHFLYHLRLRSWPDLENQIKRLVNQGLTCPAYLQELIPELLPLMDFLFPKSHGLKVNSVSVEPFMLSLFQLISKTFQPIVLCLENLQWADQESLNLLEKLLYHSDIPLLIIGTCENNVPDTIQTLVDNCKRQQVNVYQIHLESLSETPVRPFESDDLHQFQCLSETEKHFFQIASCVGPIWNVEIIRSLINQTLSEIESILQKACQHGLIVPALLTEAHYQRSQEKSLWMFSSDTIQPSLYQTLPRHEKNTYHAQIARKLLSVDRNQSSGKNIYLVAKHSQCAGEKDLSMEQRLHLARTCMSAGERALMSGLPLSSYEFFSYGLSFFSDTGLGDHHHLLFDLYLNAINAANLASLDHCLNDMEDILFTHAKNDLEKIKACECLAQIYYRQGNREKVWEMVRQGLALVHIHVDAVPEIICQLRIITTALKHRHFQKINVKNAISEKNLAHVLAMRLITCLIRTEESTHSKKIPGIIALGIKQMTRVHLTTDAAYLWVMFARYLMEMKGFQSIANSWAHLGNSLLNRLTDLRLQSETRLTCFWFIDHRKMPVYNYLDHLMGEIKKCHRQGHDDLAALASEYYLVLSLACGKKLKQLISDIYAIQSLIQNQQIFKNDLNAMCRQAVLNLISGITPPHILTGQAFDEQKAIQTLEMHSDINRLFILYSIKLMLCVLFRTYDKALVCAEKISHYIDCVKNTPVLPMAHCYSALAYLGAYHSASTEEKKAWKKTIQQHLRELKKWSDLCPENAMHRYYLVLAECSYKLDLQKDISDHYDQAIALAKANQYHHDHGLANELAGEYYAHREKEKLAKSYIEDAYQAYVSWGADRKATAYVKQEKSLQQQGQSKAFIWPSSLKNTLTKPISSEDSSAISRVDQNDIWTLSQSFCTELRLEPLLEKIIQAVLQHSGAHKGCLALKKNNAFFVEAQLNIETQERYLMTSEPLETTKHLCLPIAHHVIQTHTPVCLWDAGKQGEFQYDTYIRENAPRSLLCIPVSYADNLSGILYLENKRITNLFSAERVKRMQIIASQAAIAIKNAQFVHAQECIKQDRATDLNLTVHQLSSAIQDLEASSREMFLLNQFSDELHGCNTEPVSYDVLQVFAKRLFPADQGILWIADKESFFIATSWGDPIPEKNTLDTCSCRCFTSSTMIFIEDVTASPRCLTCGPNNDRIYLCVPLKDQSKVIGVLHFQFGLNRPRIFDDTFTRRLESRRMLVCRMIEHYALSLSNLRLREALKYESIHDPLTGLFNRRHMQKTLTIEHENALTHRQTLGVIMVDIDHFKLFNDTYGHDIGDAVLIHLGQYLKARTNDTLQACRYGGEEFLLMCPNISIEALVTTAESIRLGIMNDIKVPYQEKVLDVTASLGAALFPNHGTSMTDVLQKADQALYIAKENGRNQVALAK